MTTPTRFAVAPNGDVVAQTEEQALAGQDNGYSATDGDTYRRQQKAAASEKYVNENWGTGGKVAAGLASGLTLGLAPSLASRMGLLDRDHLESAEQTTAFGAGDVAGMVAPALLSGGESLAARGLVQGGAKGLGKVALALTPAGIMGEAGGIAERLAGKFLGESGIMGRLAAPTIRMAARGATEGAINNLAHTVSDTVIQNKPLAADALLMSGVDGALFGGLTGGILGGAAAAAGTGIDLVGGRVAGMGAGRSVEASSGKVLKYLGSSDEQLASMAGKETSVLERAAGKSKGGLEGTIHDLKDVLTKGDGAVGAGVANVRKATLVAEKGYSAGIADALQDMQKDHPNLTPQMARVRARMDTELTAQFGGTRDAQQVGGLFQQAQKQLKNVKTWEGWGKTRESLARDVDRAADGSVRKGFLQTTLNIVDDEMVGESSALMAANPELAQKYAANVVGKSQAKMFSEMTAAKAVSPPANAINVGHAVGSMGWATLVGANPLVGAGMIAGKQVLERVKQSLAAPMAEAAFRSALGAQASHATISVGNRMSNGIKAFLNGGRVAASGAHAEAGEGTKPSYTMASYQKTIEMADELTSVSHQKKVREITDALSQQGHPELAQQMAETYGRAVAYATKNKPKKGLEAHSAGKLGKTPQRTGLDTQDMKFIRQMHTMTKPLDSIMGGLERGDLSRDAVATFQNVFPAAAADLNMRVAQEVVEYRNQGKFLPADKIARLGTLLNFAVDSKLNPTFVDAVQAGLAANKAPSPDPGSPPPPPTDVSKYQTPLQSSIG